MIAKCVDKEPKVGVQEPGWQALHSDSLPVSQLAPAGCLLLNSFPSVAALSGSLFLSLFREE